MKEELLILILLMVELEDLMQQIMEPNKFLELPELEEDLQVPHNLSLWICKTEAWWGLEMVGINLVTQVMTMVQPSQVLQDQAIIIEEETEDSLPIKPQAI